MAAQASVTERGMKRAGVTTKHAGITTKALSSIMDQDRAVGAPGDYTVTDKDGKKYPIGGVIAVRVLDFGELNLVTDAGRWFLFAADTWSTVTPAQPEPGEFDTE